MDEHDIPTTEEALALAKEVSNGQTRSYVRAAMLLANYIQSCIACKIEFGTSNSVSIPTKFHVCKR